MRYNADLLYESINEVTGITKEQIMSKRRRQDILLSRHMFISITRKMSMKSLIQIGCISNKYYSTVLNSIQEAENEIDTNEKFKNCYFLIQDRYEKKIANMVLAEPNNRAYISGRITGLTEIEVNENFEKAKQRVIELGFLPILPTTISKSLNWDEAMKFALQMMFSCEVVYFMPNYLDSKGALIELYLCKKLNIEYRFLEIDDEVILCRM